MPNIDFKPKLITLFKQGFTAKQFIKDAIAGVIVGIVALPLAIAFAIASGVSPEKGLITAVIAGLIVSVLGGSRVQIGGPTGAFIVIIYGIVQTHGIDGLTIATFMAGFLIIGLGLFRLGDYLKFIPYPLIVGFTSGIAVVIFSSQIKDFLGLEMGTIPADFIEKWDAYFQNYKQMNWIAALLATGTVLISLNFNRISSRIPGSIIAIVLSTVIVYFFDIPVETIQSKFGEIPNHISLPSIPAIDFATIQQLIQPAIAIALLGSIESLLSAVVADGMVGSRHRSNTELIAQGIANIFSGLFGGMPATGAIARTATNIKNGGRTPIAGIIHALVLFLIMIFFAPIAKLIPLATLAGILVVVAWHMGEWHHFVSIFKGNRMDMFVMVNTFLLTVFFDLIIAIEVGMILSSFIFMKRMSESTSIQDASTLFNGNHENGELLFEEELPNIPDDVLIYEINGPLFFAASQKFKDVITDLKQEPEVLIFRVRHVPFIDATGVSRLKDIYTSLAKCGTKVVISGANKNVKRELLKMGVYADLGKNNVCANINEALIQANKLIDEKKQSKKNSLQVA